jgi:hypothetical protein
MDQMQAPGQAAATRRAGRTRSRKPTTTSGWTGRAASCPHETLHHPGRPPAEATFLRWVADEGYSVDGAPTARPALHCRVVTLPA